ncbi:RNB domain-containing ribonuclease [Vibrio lentus]|nr:RNB domain-containing ribonuclease [Vibrio lentus]
MTSMMRFIVKRRKAVAGVLWVAIADVSYYVRPDTALDKEAITVVTRYTSRLKIYYITFDAFKWFASLNPQVDRLCMVCEMTSGAKVNCRVTSTEAVMNSHARLTYNKVGRRDLRWQ